MSPVTRYLVVVLVRLLLIGAAAWFAFGADPLGPATPLVSRLALVLAFLLLSIVLGEVDRLRTHFGLLLAALRSAPLAAGTPGSREGVVAEAARAAAGDPALAGAAGPRDDRASIDILVKALHTRDDATRGRVHAHLKRLTGQDLPADPRAWEAWWTAAREGFQA